MENKNRTPVYSYCPYCGAQQEIDPAQDVTYCRYCGKPSPVSKTFRQGQDQGNTILGPDGKLAELFPRVDPAYYPDPPKPKKRHTFWWIAGWIFCFPIPLTILMLRNRKLPAAARIAIIALGWIVYLALGLRGRANQTLRTPSAPSIPAVVETTATPWPTTRPTATPKPTATPEPVDEGSYRWEKDGAGWHYLDGAGEPMTGWVQDEGVWYYLDEDGVMQTGWLELGDYWYYLKDSGAMAENETLTVDGTKYSFDEDGHMLEETPAAGATGVTPEFKAAMDSYEAFFDEYCEFMKAMSDDPTDFNYLLQYADMMTQYADTMEKLDAIDEDELSLADDAYYIEVMARIEVKLLEAANNMS